MNSIVIELQKEALNKNISISDLLRKALVVAKKLKVLDFEQWVTNELNGYEKAEDIPDYRYVEGSVKAWNPFHGWQPVIFPEPDIENSLSRRPTMQPVAEIESLLQARTDETSLQMLFDAEAKQILRKAIRSQTEVTLIFSMTYFVKIIDTVRNIILNWAIKLEEDGILGEGLSFTPQEKEIASAGQISYNINNFFAPVQKPQIQQQPIHSKQISKTQSLNISEVSKFVIELLQHYKKLNLTEDSEKELGAELETVKAQAGSPQPKMGIIRESLSSIRKILEGAGGGVAAQLLIQLGNLF